MILGSNSIACESIRLAVLTSPGQRISAAELAEMTRPLIGNPGGIEPL